MINTILGTMLFIIFTLYNPMGSGKRLLNWFFKINIFKVHTTYIYKYKKETLKLCIQRVQ